MASRSPDRLARAVAGALLIAGFAAPAAGARPADSFAARMNANAPASSPSQAEAPTQTVIRSIDAGFDWGAAGIGAGAGAAIVLLSLGGVRAGSRVRMHPAR